jgi:hypothetical protein
MLLALLHTPFAVIEKMQEGKSIAQAMATTLHNNYGIHDNYGEQAVLVPMSQDPYIAEREN